MNLSLVPSAGLRRTLWRKRALYLMMLPGIAYFLCFHYAPMYGAIIAFKDFSVKKGILAALGRIPFISIFCNFSARHIAPSC